MSATRRVRRIALLLLLNFNNMPQSINTIVPPAENPQYVPIDSRNFYLATTTSVQYNVDDVLSENADVQSRIDANNQMLSDASTAITALAATNTAVPALDITTPSDVTTPTTNEATS